MGFTRERTIEEHRKLWDWLAKHPEKAKWEYPEWEGNGGEIPWALYNCFPCDFTGVECEKCPFVWPDHRCIWDTGYYRHGGLFGAWVTAFDCGEFEEASKIAEQIRDLPVRAEEKGES